MAIRGARIECRSISNPGRLRATVNVHPRRLNSGLTEGVDGAQSAWVTDEGGPRQD